MTPRVDDNWTRKSWISSANLPECGYPLQNLPFCAFAVDEGEAHLGTGIGSYILDLYESARSGLLNTLPADIRNACAAPTLNALMECGLEAATHLRHTLVLLLSEDAEAASRETLRSCLRPMEGTVFRKPAAVGNYTDFYASLHHATNVGRLFRPDQPLLPNYKFIPIGYHGRASSLIIDGSSVTRPRGQRKIPSAEAPNFGCCNQLDYEVEVGAYIGSGNALGHPIDITVADQHIFGLSLLNDWSARDIQAWEYQPLGPFLAKSFATTVSPWVVTTEALAPFRVPLAPRPAGDPEPLPYLFSPDGETTIDLQLEVHILTSAMRNASLPPVLLSTGNLRDLYWSFAQMVTHHTSNGCNLVPGDLLASGTISGPHEGTYGSLLEITKRGTIPLQLPNGEARGFLEDGDEIILSGFCEREGHPRISLGECRGTIAPALPEPTPPISKTL